MELYSLDNNVFHKVVNSAPSLLVRNWAFKGFIPISWYFNLLPTELFTWGMI